MHAAYQWMWHHPCGTKINSVRKLENARVRNFYAYGNFCNYITRNTDQSVSTYMWFAHAGPSVLIELGQIAQQARQRKRSVNWVLSVLTVVLLYQCLSTSASSVVFLSFWRVSMYAHVSILRDLLRRFLDRLRSKLPNEPFIFVDGDLAGSMKVPWF